MKNALFFFLLSSTFLLSQDYIPLIQTDARWQVSIDQTATIWNYDHFYEYTPGQDTVIDNTGYTTIWAHGFFRPNIPGGLEVFPQPFEPGGKQLRALLREDLIAQSVFCRLIDMNAPSGFSDEFLLYDFSLEVGDEVYDFLVSAGPYFVENIYSTSLYGMERRVWVLDNGVEITEGIGSSFGLIEGITLLVSGAYPELHRYCQGSAMDCNVEVDGMVNRKRQFNVNHSALNFSNGASYKKTFEYRFLGTMETNNHTYFLAQNRQPDEQDEFSSFNVSFFEGDTFLFRQENEKIYRRNFFEEEILIYDFSMDVGDSISYYYNWSNEYVDLVVTEIDSITLLNGEKRAYFHLATTIDNQPETTWISGIGNEFHPLFPDYSLHEWYNDGERYKFTCYFENFEESEIYSAPDSNEGCYVYIVGNEDIPNKDQLKIYPNPANNELFLSEFLENGTLTIRTTLGQVVGQFPTDNSSINLQSLPAGCYFYQIKNDSEQQVSAGRLIKL